MTFKPGDKVVVKYPWPSDWNEKGTVDRTDGIFVFVRADAGEFKGKIGGHLEERIKLEEPMTLKVGDKVKLLRIVRSYSDGWGNAWISEMDKAVGKTGTVVKVGVFPHNVEVKFDGVDRNYGYPDFALELVQDLKPVVGAKVKVNYTPGSSWNNEGTITKLRTYSATVLMSAGLYKGQEGAFDLAQIKVLSLPEEVQTKVVDQNTTVVVKAPGSFKTGDRVTVDFSDFWRGPATYDKYEYGFHFVKMDDGRRGGFYLKNLTALVETPAAVSAPKTDNRVPAPAEIRVKVLPAVAPASTQQPINNIRVSSVPLTQALATAISLAKSNSIKRVTADQVRTELDKHGIKIKNLGAVFQKGGFRNTGVYVPSNQPTRRGGRIAVWEYTGA